MNDDEAIELFQRGGFEGGKVLVERYQADVYNVALRLVGNRADAEDVAQDTFVAALQRIDQFRPGLSFGAWLAGIARHRGLDLLRRRGRRPALPVSMESDVEEVAVGELEDRRVRQALDRLPERDRALLVLRYWEDLTVAEVAQSLGMSTGATKVALLRARRSVAKMLGDDI